MPVVAEQGKFPDYPRRDPSTAHRSIGDEGGLVVVPAKAAVQVLNPVGSLVYGMLDGKHSREEIVRAVVAEYDVTEEVVRADLEQFLSQLGSKEMLAAEDEPDE